MRKIILTALAAATMLSSAPAMAQSYGEYRNSVRELRKEQHDLRRAERYGSRRDVAHARRDVREARRNVDHDWRDYRRSHRDVFRGGSWRAPFRYSTFAPGARIDRQYYGSRYVINDPYRYRLARPGSNMRWVRHYNDVLLVNVRTGRVVQVHRNFYW